MYHNQFKMEMTRWLNKNHDNPEIVLGSITSYKALQGRRALLVVDSGRDPHRNEAKFFEG